MAKAEITYDTYMSNLDEANRVVLGELFTRAKAILPNHSVNMKYGFPLLDGFGKFGFAQKASGITLYFHHHQLAEVVAKYHTKLGQYKLDKESIKYKKAAEIPLEQILEIIKELFTETESFH